LSDPVQGRGAGGSWKALLLALLAAALTASLYWLRVDSAMYFLHGAEAQGLLLAKALASGQGFVEISLPGSPAHVREPPLFYLCLAGLIKLFGFRLYPMKVFVWAGYVLSAGLGVWLFSKRAPAFIAFFGLMTVMSSPELFRFFTGPKSDIPYTALSLGAILALEWLAFQVLDRGRKETRRKILPYVFAAALCVAALYTRSLGLALALGGAGALVLTRGAGAGIPKRVFWAAALLAPVTAGFFLWSARNASLSNPSGFDYLDWFLIDLEPDSPAMMALDFHSPLLDYIPRSGPLGLVKRTAVHAVKYPLNTVKQALGYSGGESVPLENGITAALLAVVLAGMWSSERRRPPVVPLYILIYLGVICVWPMDDPRLLLPLVPFAGFYFIKGTALIGGWFFITARKRLRGTPAFPPPEHGGPAGKVCAAAVATAIIASGVYSDLKFFESVSKVPMISHKPGFEFRFLGKEMMHSFMLLDWVSHNTPHEAVPMYHSVPPCRLVSGRACRAIPFGSGLDEVRDYIVSGGADYLVMDEWGRKFEGGPGWFVENILRPMVKKYPHDFERVYRIHKTEAEIFKVKRIPGRLRRSLENGRSRRTRGQRGDPSPFGPGTVQPGKNGTRPGAGAHRNSGPHRNGGGGQHRAE